MREVLWALWGVEVETRVYSLSSHLHYEERRSFIKAMRGISYLYLVTFMECLLHEAQCKLSSFLKSEKLKFSDTSPSESEISLTKYILKNVKVKLEIRTSWRRSYIKKILFFHLTYCSKLIVLYLKSKYCYGTSNNLF